jgi:regulator of sigma D
MAYEYTLEDIYKIYQQAEDKVAQLIEFRDLKMPFDIKWDRIIEINLQKSK